MTDTEIIQKIWSLCQTILGPQYRLFLFGSRSEKSNDPNSDFDFLIKGEKPVPFEAWQKITDAVQEIPTLYKIDLVDYMSSSEDFKKVASKSAKEIIDGQVRHQSGINST